MTATIVIDQAGLPAGLSGFARTDGLATGAVVTLSNATPGATNTFRLLWVPPGDTSAVSTLAAVSPPAGPVWTFTPTALQYGTYLVELVVDAGLPTEARSRKAFVIRTPARGLIIPALNEIADPSASLLSSGSLQIEAADQNEAFSPFIGGSYAGWWRSYAELVAEVESGSLGSLAGDVTGAPGANTVSLLQTVPLNLAGITTGDVLTYNGTDIVGAPGGGGGGFELSGPGNVSVSTIGVEQLVGGFFLTPGAATTGILNAQVIRINGGGSPSFAFRLYDMGTPGTPGPGVLVTTAFIASGGVYGANQIASQSFAVVPLITGIDEILDTPRMYELRALVAGSVGDSALIISSAIEIS